MQLGSSNQGGRYELDM